MCAHVHCDIFPLKSNLISLKMCISLATEAGLVPANCVNHI